jgi:hypothetical protein
LRPGLDLQVDGTDSSRHLRNCWASRCLSNAR